MCAQTHTAPHEGLIVPPADTNVHNAVDVAGSSSSSESDGSVDEMPAPLFEEGLAGGGGGHLGEE